MSTIGINQFDRPIRRAGYGASLPGRATTALFIVGAWLVLAVISFFSVLEALSPRSGVRLSAPAMTIGLSLVVMVGLFVGMLFVSFKRSTAVLKTMLVISMLVSLINLAAIGAFALIDVAVLAVPLALLCTEPVTSYFARARAYREDMSARI